MLCTVCNCILHDMILPHSIVLRWCQAYTPDLNFTERICTDPTDLKCKSKICRSQVNAGRFVQKTIHGQHVFFMFPFLFYPKRGTCCCKGTLQSVASKSGMYTLYLKKTFFFAMLQVTT